jgi:hypothetical protein
MKEWWAHPNTVARARMRDDARWRFAEVFGRGLLYDGDPLHQSALMPDDGLFHREPNRKVKEALARAKKNAPTEAGAS